MTETTTTTATLTKATSTIGIDLGDRKSHICVLDEAGQILEEGTVATTAAGLCARFQRCEPTRIAIEAGGQSGQYYDLLNDLLSELQEPRHRGPHGDPRGPRRAVAARRGALHSDERHDHQEARRRGCLADAPVCAVRTPGDPAQRPREPAPAPDLRDPPPVRTGPAGGQVGGPISISPD